MDASAREAGGGRVGPEVAHPPQRVALRSARGSCGVQASGSGRKKKNKGSGPLCAGHSAVLPFPRAVLPTTVFGLPHTHPRGRSRPRKKKNARQRGCCAPAASRLAVAPLPRAAHCVSRGGRRVAGACSARPRACSVARMHAYCPSGGWASLRRRARHAAAHALTHSAYTPRLAPRRRVRPTFRRRGNCKRRCHSQQVRLSCCPWSTRTRPLSTTFTPPRRCIGSAPCAAALLLLGARWWRRTEAWRR